jgi:hypothetical protein
MNGRTTFAEVSSAAEAVAQASSSAAPATARRRVMRGEVIIRRMK